MAERLAEVVCWGGRLHLRVAGFYLATEGDKCRDGNLPEEVYSPIPEAELERATIGGKPVKDLPADVVRFFRGDIWNERMLEFVAEAINRQAAEARQ
jgi:hypothetical protein